MATGSIRPTASIHAAPGTFAGFNTDTATLDGSGTASTIGLDVPIVLSTLNLGVSGAASRLHDRRQRQQHADARPRWQHCRQQRHEFDLRPYRAGRELGGQHDGRRLVATLRQRERGVGGNRLLTLSGNGQLILSGSGNYTGGTTVSSGTLDVTNPSRLVRRFEPDRGQRRRVQPSAWRAVRRGDGRGVARRFARCDVGGGSRTGDAGPVEPWERWQPGLAFGGGENTGTSNQLTGWVEHGRPAHGALCEPVQNSDKRSQGFDSVRNPPFPPRFAPRTLRSSNQQCRRQPQKTVPDMLRQGGAVCPEIPRQSGLFRDIIVDFADVFCSNQAHCWLIGGM